MNDSLRNSSKNAIVLLRILIGWHFLYEGIVKIYDPGWTAKGYLLNSEGFMNNIFAWLASDGIIGTVDFINMMGLTLVGLGLMVGLWDKLAAISGAILLMFYYLSYPPFPGLQQVGAEGNYWIVNKNLIEAAALLVLFNIPTGRYFGIMRLFGTARKTQ